MAIAIALIVLAVGSVLFHFLSPWYFTPIASNWATIDHTISITFWVTGFVFLAVSGFTAWAVIRYRHRKDARAEYEPENKKLEWRLLIVTTLGVAAMLALGVPWGLAAGFFGAAADEVLMRIADALLSFPPLILAIGVVSALGPSISHAMVTVGVISAPGIARLLRSAVLPVRDAQFVLIARSLGASRLRIAARHVQRLGRRAGRQADFLVLQRIAVL